jgi:type III secretory pathway lipoprotein EscJ
MVSAARRMLLFKEFEMNEKQAEELLALLRQIALDVEKIREAQVRSSATELPLLLEVFE